MAALDLSICVVLYESMATTQRFHLALCESLKACSKVEVLYYDNSVGNELQEWFKGRTGESVSYTRDSRNLGFSYGNNQLILRARYGRILLLNPDVFGMTRSFWEHLSSLDTRATVRFARLLNEDGSFQDCVGEPVGIGRAFSGRPDYESFTHPTEVGMGIMAFMLADKATFASVGLLDCDYPLYAEDMDWCFRAKRRGLTLLYDPGLVLTHIGGASAKARWKRVESLRKKFRAERLFVDKHFRGLEWAFMRALNAVKILVKAR